MSTSLSPIWYGRLVGALAAIASLGFLQFTSWRWNALSILDALADGVLLLMPLSVFSATLDLFGTQAKTLLYVGVALIIVLIGAWLVGRIGAQKRRASDIWPRAMANAGIGFLIIVGLLFLIRDGGLGQNAIRTLIALGAGALLYGGLTAWLLGSRDEVVFADAAPDRRSAVRLLAGGAIALLGLGTMGRDVTKLATRQVVGGESRETVAPAITPNDDFYQISKNFSDPQDEMGAEWSINLAGLVDMPRALYLDDLLTMTEQHSISTMLCISNTVGGDLIGTAEWTGVPLSMVLKDAGVHSGATRVIFRGLDDYSTAVPIDRVMHPQAFLVWGMNGEPLPRNHGGPVRAIIPGLYGMKSVKWLMSIEPTIEDYQGFWEQRDWTNAAIVKPMSRIDVPQNNEVLAVGNVEIGGVAFAGDRGIERVEISVDGGEAWQAAEIREQPNPDGVAWVIWGKTWDASAGEHEIVVRLIDSNGETQTADTASPLPDGSSGWHSIRVGVV